MLSEFLIDRLGHLLPTSTTPFAIAFSGGSDSTALLHALKDHPQLKAVYVLDHGLRSGSDIEALQARDFAAGLGLYAEVLSWKSQFIKSNIQNLARQARYGLIGVACREAGIEYLLTGHHRDDQAETLLMRYDHKTGWRGAAGMAESTYAPLWSELACVTVLRPLLTIPRANLREYNKAHKLSWIEDPSNRNQNFERVRARTYLSKHPHIGDDLLAAQVDLRQGLRDERRILADFAKAHVRFDENGIIRLRKLCPPELLYHLLRVASGEGRLINRAKIKNMLGLMQFARFTSATLGGALIRRNPSEHGFILCRDLAAVTGRKDNNLPPPNLSVEFRDYPQIWDGRFMMKGPRDYRVDSAYAAGPLMTKAHMCELREHPVAIRQTLPVIIKGNEIVAIGDQDANKQAPYKLMCLNKRRLESALATKLP